MHRLQQNLKEICCELRTTRIGDKTEPLEERDLNGTVFSLGPFQLS